ncbi:FG-GAP-like repeat-containing protein [Pleionea sp. CnH1-48]|uniref:FG-GAP-like repeat-containing protein n=1 Tax=Pleionea sp. CnH1-48 TaxID=2954494 RepID=UPI00209826C6|nr:FG-GAP-like repeat-containing protein [Pleionea sp. CnH1-48]MCO7223009.1 FG-GAP-like repeat-containing protein [Pleionea sp. CnH1-48]
MNKLLKTVGAVLAVSKLSMAYAAVDGFDEPALLFTDLTVSPATCTLPQGSSSSTCNITFTWESEILRAGTVNNKPCLKVNGSIISGTCKTFGTRVVALPEGQHKAIMTNQAAFQEKTVVVQREAYTPPFSWTTSSHKEIVGDFDGDGDSDILVQPLVKTSQVGLFPKSQNDHFDSRIHKAWTNAHPQISAITDWSNKQYGAYAANLKSSPGDEVLLAGRKTIVLISGDVITPVTLFPKVKNAIVSWDANRNASYTEFSFKEDINKFNVLFGDFDGDGLAEIFLQAKSERGTSYVLNSDGSISQTIGYNYQNTDWSSATYRLEVRDVNGDGRDDIVMVSLRNGTVNNTAYFGTNGRIVSLETSISHIAENANTLSSSTGPQIGNYQEDSLNVGAIPASSMVSPDGSFNYTMPIMTTGAIGETAPSLSFSYNSYAGAGPMGEGWSVSGFSLVSRCPTTVEAPEQASGSIQFNADDKLCLDGQRLIRQTNLSGTKYKTETDNFSLISAFGGSTDNPDYFEVTYTDGSSAIYGKLTSKIVAPNSGKTYAWALQKYRDVHGNFIEYKYIQTSNDLEFHLSEVLYTANEHVMNSAKSRIVFNYSDGAPRPHKAYLAGEPISVSKRLDSVDSYSDGYLLRSYTMEYDSTHNLLDAIEVCNSSQCLPKTRFDWIEGTINPDDYFAQTRTGEAFSDNRNKGFRVADVNGDGMQDMIAIRNHRNDPDDHMMVFVYDPSIDNLRYTDRMSQFADKAFRGSWQFIDVNNDAKQDIIFEDGGYWRYVLSIGNEYNPTIYSLRDINGALIPATGHKYTRVADFNSDGLPDILTVDNNKFVIRPMVHTTQSGQTLVRFGNPIDVTYDLSRLQQNNSDESNASYSFAVETREMSDNLRLADYNGDGVTDLLVKVTERRVVHTWDDNCDFGDGEIPKMQQKNSAKSYKLQLEPIQTNGFCNSYVSTRTDWRVITHEGNGLFKEFDVIGSASYIKELNPIDLNVDGYPELVYFNSSASRWYKLDNNGKEFVNLSVISQLDSDEEEVRFADINMDGYTDLLYVELRCRYYQTGCTITNLQQSWFVKYYDGTGFSTATELDMSTSDASVSAFHDVNGDGVSDYFSFDGDWKYQARHNRSLKKIIKVTDGLGMETTVSYRPLTDTSVYTKGNSSNLDYSNWGRGSVVNDLMVPMYVVATFNQRDEHIAYKYKNGRFQVGRGPLGFGTIEVEHVNTGTKVISEYRQDHPYTGALKSQKTQLVTYSTTPTFNFNCKFDDYVEDCDDFMSSTTVTETYTLSDKTVNYAEKQTGTDVSYIYPYKSETIHYDFPTRVETHREVDEVIQIDNFNNVTRSRKTVVDKSQDVDVSFVTNSVFNYDDYSIHYGGRLKSQGVTSSQSNLAGNLVRSMSFEYDSLGRLNKTYKEKGRPEFEILTEVVSRDSFGNITHTRVSGLDIETQNTKMTYDSTGRYVQYSFNALNHGSENVYSSKAKAFGYVDAAIDAKGSQVQWVYSDLGRKKSETKSNNTQVFISQRWCSGVHANAGYQATDCPSQATYVEITEETGKPTKKEYFDKNARSVRTSVLGFDGEWVHADTLYHSLGMIEKKSQPYRSGEVMYYTEYYYDELNRLKKTIRPDGSEWKTEYDKFSSITINPNGLRHTETKNAIEQLIKVNDTHAGEGKNLSSEYKYDLSGNLIELDGPLAGDQDKVVLGYDSKGYFKTSMNDPSKGSWSYRNDPLGRVVWQRNSEGQESTSEYDVLGRISRQVRYFGKEGQSAKEADTEYFYDNAFKGSSSIRMSGEKEKVIDHVSGMEKVFVYDDFGRVEETVTSIDGRVFSEQVVFDSIGRTQDIIDASGGKTRYFYNEHGYRYASADMNSKNVHWQALSSDRYGKITETRLHNNTMIQTSTYDPKTGLVRTAQSGRTGGTGQEFQDEDYYWDVLGNLEWRKDFSVSGVRREETFDYDAINRLTSATAAGFTPQSVRYDDSGNITYKSDVGYYCYTGSGPHAVTRIQSSACSGGESADYQYDQKGNMLQGRGRTLTYTTYDKPKTIATSGYNVEFFYGLDLSRYKRTETKSGVTTTTLYIGNTEFVTESNKSGEAIRRNIDGVASELTSQSGVKTTQYLFKDHLGSLVFVATSSGAEVQRSSYDPWGKRRPTNWSAGSNSFTSIASLNSLEHYNRGYTGQEHVDDAGLIHMNGRIYDPILGRFLSADPYVQAASNQQNLNRYSYVLNNPMNATDPSGYWVQIVVAIIAKIASYYAYTTLVTVLYTLNTIYSYYQTMKAIVGVIQAIQAWSRGAGGGIFGDMAKGFAKSYVRGLGESFVAGAICNQECANPGTNYTDMGRDLDDAQASSCVYLDSCTGTDNLRRLTDKDGKFINPQDIQTYNLGKLKNMTFVDSDTGFQSALFIDKNTGEFVLAYAGTNDLTDVWVDIKQAFGLETKHYNQGIALAKKVNSVTGGNVRFTGHSLGGGLASAAAVVTGRRAVTFNAAGVHQNTVGKGYDMSKASVRAYYNGTDLLSVFQDNSFFAPGALGERIALPAYNVHMMSGICKSFKFKCYE